MSAAKHSAEADPGHEVQGVAAQEDLLLPWVLQESGRGWSALHRLWHGLLSQAIAQACARALKGCYTYSALRLENVSRSQETPSKLNQLGDGSSRHKSG